MARSQSEQRRSECARRSLCTKEPLRTPIRRIIVVMVDGTSVRRWRRLAAAAVVIYSVFLATAEFEHHDLACHFKTPFHCTSCASSPLSVNPHTAVVPDVSRLADAGRTIAVQVPPEAALLPLLSSVRPPPPSSLTR